MDSNTAACLAYGCSSGIPTLLKRVNNVPEIILDRCVTSIDESLYVKRLELIAMSELRNRAWAGTKHWRRRYKAIRKSIDMNNETVRIAVARRVERMQMELKICRTSEAAEQEQRLSAMRAKEEAEFYD